MTIIVVKNKKMCYNLAEKWIQEDWSSYMKKLLRKNISDNTAIEIISLFAIIGFLLGIYAGISNETKNQMIIYLFISSLLPSLLSIVFLKSEKR
ncbi:hypothetical protein [Streptococcus pluranimalium]|uniref:hypothetical protein n=1 Tax=Streptococcus pluranimalium TaxID=82348 RepID=UPI003F693ADD